MTLLELIEQSAAELSAAGVAFGHGTTNAFDEAAWLVLWRLGLPLDSALEGPDAAGQSSITPANQKQVALLIATRIETRKPAAYLTHEAWLQGVAFYVDERVIVPRSLIAELLVNGGIDPWLGEHTTKVLDLCTGNGSLAILAAMAFPDVVVAASDFSADALAVAQINVDKHALAGRIALFESDGLTSPELQACGPFDLILCNPPYVNAQSMASLPLEFQAEPAIALDGNRSGGTDGMDFMRALLGNALGHLSAGAVLVLEIGPERDHFQAAFPTLEVVWLETETTDDQVFLLTREALQAFYRNTSKT